MTVAPLIVPAPLVKHVRTGLLRQIGFAAELLAELTPPASCSLRYLHYTPDSAGSAKLTALWGERGGPDDQPASSQPEPVIALRPVA